MKAEFALSFHEVRPLAFGVRMFDLEHLAQYWFWRLLLVVVKFTSVTLLQISPQRDHEWKGT